MAGQNGHEDTFVLRKRHRYERGFTILDNLLLQDTKRLSLRAIGTGAHLWSLPDDTPVNAAKIAERTKEGREAVRTALNELAAAGYLERERRQVERGRWVTYVWISDRPMDKTAGGTEDGFPGVGQPDVGGLGAKNVKDEGKDSPSTSVDGRGEDPTASTLLASWLDRSGVKLTPPTRARLGKGVKELLTAGEPEQDIAAGLDLYGERLAEGARITPGNLPDFVDQARNRREARAEQGRERTVQRQAARRDRNDDPVVLYQTGTPERVSDDKLYTPKRGALLEAAGLSVPEHVRERLEPEQEPQP